MMSPGPALDEARAAVERAAVAAGRDPATLGMEGRVDYRQGRDRVAQELAAWSAAGATYVSINTMGAGLGGVDGHLAALEAVAADF
jgi:hypothetical protein